MYFTIFSDEVKWGGTVRNNDPIAIVRIIVFSAIIAIAQPKP